MSGDYWANSIPEPDLNPPAQDRWENLYDKLDYFIEELHHAGRYLHKRTSERGAPEGDQSVVEVVEAMLADYAEQIPYACRLARERKEREAKRCRPF